MKHISQLLVDVAKYLANPRIEAAAWEARNAQVEPEACDPFCWCLDCQEKFDEEADEVGFANWEYCWNCDKRVHPFTLKCSNCVPCTYTGGTNNCKCSDCWF